MTAVAHTRCVPGLNHHCPRLRFNQPKGLPRRLDESVGLYETEAPMPLADDECVHGRLAHDRTPDCGCFPVSEGGLA